MFSEQEKAVAEKATGKLRVVDFKEIASTDPVRGSGESFTRDDLHFPSLPCAHIRQRSNELPKNNGAFTNID